MSTLGEILRHQRESCGLSLGQVAESTKIRSTYLAALESGDFESLPGGVYNRGYLRTYAREVGADADTLIRTYVREERARLDRSARVDRAGRATDSEDAILRRLSDQVDARRDAGAGPIARLLRRWRLVLLTPVLAALALIAVWALLKGPQPSAAAPGVATTQEEPAGALDDRRNEESR